MNIKVFELIEFLKRLPPNWEVYWSEDMIFYNPNDIHDSVDGAFAYDMYYFNDIFQ